MNLANVKCLVVDNGLFVDLAVRLARDFGKVWYYTPWEQSFPLMNHGRIGEGLEEIERVRSVFGKHFNDVDLFVFPDIFHADLQDYLVGQGKRVWGGRGTAKSWRRNGKPAGRSWRSSGYRWRRGGRSRAWTKSATISRRTKISTSNCPSGAGHSRRSTPTSTRTLKASWTRSRCCWASLRRRPRL